MILAIRTNPFLTHRAHSNLVILMWCGLKKDRNLDFHESVIAQFNINSIRNMFHSLSEQIQGNVDMLMICETKINNSFPNGQFQIKGFNAQFHWRSWWGAFGAVAPPSRKRFPTLKKHKNELFCFFVLTFVRLKKNVTTWSFCWKISIGAAKTTHNESFKNNDCSIAI